MKTPRARTRSLFGGLAAALLLLPAARGGTQGAAKRPMTFVDVVTLRSAGGVAPSPDRKWALTTLTVPDWKAAKSFSDVYLVSMSGGVPTARQMTFTKEKNESDPRWSRDGKFFVFLSNRDAAGGGAQNQLYLMRPDGGEARQLTDAREGVGRFAFSKDGKWLAYTTGKADEQQLWRFAVATLENEPAKQLTKHATGVGSWKFAPDGKRIYFTAADELDKDNRERREKQFTVRVRNEDSPPVHLWVVDLDSGSETRLTSGKEYSVTDVSVSDDSKWLGFCGIANERYRRTITEARNHGDLYLLQTETGQLERLTKNEDISESGLSFSPDSQWLAFSAANDFQYFRNSRVYLRRVGEPGAPLKKLGDGFDGDASVGFWAKDGKTIYFNEGIRATNQFCAVSTETGKVTQLTREQAALTVTQDEDTDAILIGYSDPQAPRDWYTVPSLDQIPQRERWVRLTDANPQARGWALGQTEVVTWKSSDGREIEGIVVKPVGYEAGKRYPLVVQIHGGPAGADVLAFEGGSSNYSHVYAAAGYVCFQPNYRGSINYGERHKTEIAGDYFRLGYDDIMSGVDHLIAGGLVDPDRMGVMGWSAGGHWSNWILTHTNRFKAISSGAGAVNWLSMYAETDVQRNREFYFGGAPYERFEHYWDVSPLKYIKNARTPTLIHVVDGDPRVPRPQSEELYMALRKLNVPTEFLVYPGSTHGIPDPRNRMVKMVTEFNWFEKWLRGKDRWFEWKDVLATLQDPKPAAPMPAAAGDGR